jgi:hypothetical protein
MTMAGAANPGEKPVSIQWQTCEQPLYVSVDKAVNKLCVEGAKAVFEDGVHWTPAALFQRRLFSPAAPGTARRCAPWLAEILGRNTVGLPMPPSAIVSPCLALVTRRLAAAVDPT